MRNPVAVVVAVALVIEAFFKLLHAVLSGRIKPEEVAHHRSLSLVDYQPFVVLPIAEYAAVAENYARLYRLLMTELHAA